MQNQVDLTDYFHVKNPLKKSSNCNIHKVNIAKSIWRVIFTIQIHLKNSSNCNIHKILQNQVNLTSYFHIIQMS